MEDTLMDPPRFRFIVKCRKCHRKFNTNIFESDCPFCYVEGIGAAIEQPPPQRENTTEDIMKDWQALSKIG